MRHIYIVFHKAKRFIFDYKSCIFLFYFKMVLPKSKPQSVGKNQKPNCTAIKCVKSVCMQPKSMNTKPVNQPITNRPSSRMKTSNPSVSKNSDISEPTKRNVAGDLVNKQDINVYWSKRICI